MRHLWLTVVLSGLALLALGVLVWQAITLGRPSVPLAALAAILWGGALAIPLAQRQGAAAPLGRPLCRDCGQPDRSHFGFCLQCGSVRLTGTAAPR